MMNAVIMPTSERNEIARVIREIGKKPAAIFFEVHVDTLARAAGGMGVARSTAAALRSKLLQQPRPVA